MARRSHTTELVRLLTLLRRIVVLGVAIFGLLREMPYPTLLLRLLILWAVLYVASGLLDVVMRHLTYRALTAVSPAEEPDAATETAALSPSRSR